MSTKLSKDREFIFRLTLVSWVLDNPGVKLDEVAAHFDVPKEVVLKLFKNHTTVPIPESGQFLSYIDINWDALEELEELEISDHPGLNRVPKLNHKEAAALISGLQMLKNIAGQEELPIIDSLLAKLSAGSTVPTSIVQIEKPPANKDIADIRSAMEENKTITIEYTSYDGTRTTRTVEPHEIFSSEGNWYVQTWCRLRKAPRSFRINQISSIVINDEKFEKRELLNNWASSFANVEAQKVILEVDPQILPLIADWNFTVIDEKTVEIPVFHFHSLKRLVTKFAGKIKVLSPEKAVREVSNWAQDALNNYAQ